MAIGALVFGVTRGTERASRILYVVGDKIPGLSGDRLEQAVATPATLSASARDRAHPGRVADLGLA